MVAKNRKLSKKKSKKKRNKKNCDKKMSVKQFAKKISNSLKKSNPKNIDHALVIARKVVKNETKKIVKPGKGRIIPVPKQGGFLQYLPLIASALGVVPTVKKLIDMFRGKKNIVQNKSTNPVLVDVDRKTGMGLYLKPYKKGLGLVFL